MKRGLFEREERRLEQLTERDSDRTRYPFGWREDFCPGTLGCQEALHLAQVFGALVERELAEHPAVLITGTGSCLLGGLATRCTSSTEPSDWRIPSRRQTPQR